MAEEISNQEVEEETFFPDYIPDQGNFEWGIKEGSYLAGFTAILGSLGLTEENLTNIILNKMNLEYQKEITRMQLETEERIASIYAKTPINIMGEE